MTGSRGLLFCGEQNVKLMKRLSTYFKTKVVTFLNYRDCQMKRLSKIRKRRQSWCLRFGTRKKRSNPKIRRSR